MKFKIKCKRFGEADSASWWEDYDIGIKDPDKWAQNTLERFNATLRPGEKPRELLKVEVLDEDESALHHWDKDITTMSAMFRGRMYDGMYCTKCGITGKRYGLSSKVTVDSKYRAKAFRRCDTAKIAMRDLV